ncbi:MAG: MBL fold hydrolase [Dehalococcoidia bacterium CG2_30_46_9]|nr:MAG: MBL fold hydrolase [Dehalococcoidia bacterium CG2_30_46_9]
MHIELTFLGAAQNVTGSQYLVKVNNVSFLVDCGLYQERELRGRNWQRFYVPPQTLGAVLLTHSHLDHCGLLPRLVREGFYRPIYCTAATAEIAEIILADSANIQQEDAEFKRRRHEREGRRGRYPEIPLYTTDNAKACLPLFSSAGYGKTIEIGDGLEVTFYDAGHVLGSAMIKVVVGKNGDERTIIFSGDIGGWDKPILHNPSLFEEADYVLVESTYGDRSFENGEEAADELAEVINMTAKKGGNIVIPSFALERSQEILYYLNRLLLENRIPHLMVFVDSPMAVNVTKVFEHYPELLDADVAELMRQGKSPFDFPGLNLVRTIDESKAINHIVGSVIIIAGSGMCTGGRIKHHLVTNISRPDSTVVFVGYQAEGTLGRHIVDGAKEVRILGQHYPVRARVVQLNGFSSHADKTGLIKWLSNFSKPPRCLFVTHGEPDASRYFSNLVIGKTGWEVVVPNYQDKVLLD